MGLLKDIINECDNPAILLGNGINLVNNTFSNWDELIKKIGGVKIQSEGLTNTEIYDFITLRTRNLDLKQKVINNLQSINMHKLELHRRFLEIVAAYNCPVLTTNFDTALEKAGGLNFYKTTALGFTRYYPWSVYAATAEIGDSLNTFAIWHIHGVVNYKDSIRLGLTDYMGSVEKARKLIYKRKKTLFSAAKPSTWKGADTWLHIWFHKPLIIIGLGLKPDEVFIRWLLIERKKYFNRYPSRAQKTYFLSTGNDNRLDNFLFNLNIEHLGTNKGYADLYQ